MSANSKTTLIVIRCHFSTWNFLNLAFPNPISSTCCLC